MTKKDKCETLFLAYIFIDTSTQEGLSLLNDTLSKLSITFEDFKEFLNQIPHNEKTRFSVYEDVRNFSAADKDTVRNLVSKTYLNGGKQGTEYALFYFKEIIDECDLANARIQL